MSGEQNKPRMRYAFEWYVNKKDEWYWKRTNEMIKCERQRTVTLIILSITVSIIATVISAFSLICKLQ